MHRGPSTLRSNRAVADRPRPSVAMALIEYVAGEAVSGASIRKDSVGSAAAGTLQPESSSQSGAPDGAVA